jgi:hypothetical protein
MHLLENIPEAEILRQNVINLLSSKDDGNIKLALQLIEGGGLHESFKIPLACLAYSYLFHCGTDKWCNLGRFSFKKNIVDINTQNVECEFIGESFCVKMTGFADLINTDGNLRVVIKPELITQKQHGFKFKFILDWGT